MQTVPQNTGWIEVVCGPMFSGKTEELIRRLRRALYARQRIQVFKPRLDDRYADLEIVSHTKQRLVAHPVDDAADIPRLVHADTEVVAIDEAQFFNDALLCTADQLAHGGRRVLIAGLDQDFQGKPFGPMPALLCMAEFITKTLAICVVCGNPAGRSQRTDPHVNKVLIGADEAYEARCRCCHTLEPAMPTQHELFAPRLPAVQMEMEMEPSIARDGP